MTLYVCLGFGVFKVNYVGSTGTRFDTTRNLNGKISKLDVPQVHQLVNELIESNSNIDSKHIFLCGGSHGGFIVTHLSSQYPVCINCTTSTLTSGPGILFLGDFFVYTALVLM